MIGGRHNLQWVASRHHETQYCFLSDRSLADLHVLHNVDVFLCRRRAITSSKPVQLTLSSERSRNDCALQRTPTQTTTRHLASLPVYELVFCRLLMTLSATSHGDFPHNVVGRMQRRPHLGTLNRKNDKVHATFLPELSEGPLGVG